MARRLARGEAPASGSFYPVKLDLRIVYGCNLRCKMCGQWGDTGTYFSFESAKLRRQLDLPVIERVADELLPHGLRYVDLEGGETFLHPQIIEILHALKSRGLFVKPVTNGTRLDRFARDVVEAGIDAIHVSLDGDRETNNQVRHESLRRLCDDLSGQGLVDVISVKMSPIWMPREKGKAYEELMSRHFGIDRGLDSWKGFVEDYSDFEEQAEQIAAAVGELKSKGYDFFVDGLPGIEPKDLPRMYTDYEWDLGRGHCPIPYVEPTIEADGNVYPCNLFTDEPVSMGNVNEQPFLDIWFGEKFEAFRRMLRQEGGLLPICNRCCQLTES
jgi:radical SAM protein with 4Fe4S-binding SPASM domain